MFYTFCISISCFWISVLTWNYIVNKEVKMLMVYLVSDWINSYKRKNGNNSEGGK